MKNRFILLSFDVEEFDMPLEYNFAITPEEQMKKGMEGLDKILPIINDKNISTTLFTTANFANHFPGIIKTLADRHEIASHTFFHSSFKNEDLLQSRLTLEEISGKPLMGLRMPRMAKVDMAEVAGAGYTYDSSINPTWIPGRYNHLNVPRTVHTQEGMLRIPASVSPFFRLPLFWLAFKNYPYWLYKKLVIQTLKKDGYVCLYFHPWEFTEIHDYNLPAYAKRYCGNALQERLKRLISEIKEEGDFISIANYLDLAKKKN